MTLQGRRCEHCLRELGITSCQCRYDGVPRNVAPALPEGTRLNRRYMLGKTEGQGGFSICYRAWDEDRREIVAIKELFPAIAAIRYYNDNVTVPPDQKANFQRAMDGMRREAEVLKHLVGMPAVVQVRDYFPANGTGYLVAGFLRGRPYDVFLADRFAETGWHPPIGTAINVARHVSGVLEAVHRRNMQHLDVKPPNIRVLDDGRFVLLDFGSARDAFRQGGEGSFTPGFAALEQSDASAPTTPATDVHGLAATLYYSLCLYPPVQAKERAQGAKLVPLRSYNPDVPEELDHIVQTALSLDPRERTPTSTAFAKAIAPFSENEAHGVISVSAPAGARLSAAAKPVVDGFGSGENNNVSAPLWQRVVSGMLDGSVFAVLTSALLSVGLLQPEAPSDWLFDLMLGALVLLLAQYFMAGTPGMRLLRLRVQARHGEAATVLALAARTALAFCFGPVLLVTGNEEGLLLHDRLTSTRVVAS